MAIGAGDLVVNLRMNNKSLLQGYDGAARVTEDYSQRLLRNTSALGGVDSAMDRHTSLLVQQTRVRQSLNDAIFEDTAAYDELVPAMSKAGNEAGSVNTKNGALSRGFLELSRGAEDFAAVVGTSGVAGGLRAASNNITQFLSILAPGVGAVGGFAVAIGTVLIPRLIDMGKTAQESKQQLEDMLATFDRASERRQTARDVGAIGPTGPGMEPAEDALSETRNRLRTREADLRELEAQIRSKEDVLSLHSGPRVQGQGGGPVESIPRGERRGLLNEMIQSRQLQEAGIGPDSELANTLRTELGRLRDDAAATNEEVNLLRAREQEMMGRVQLERDRTEEERQAAQFAADEEQLRANRQITPAQFGAAPEDAAAILRRETEREAERGLLQRAGSLALAELERSSRDTLRRVNPNLSAEQSQFLAGQALGGGELSDEKKRIRLAELTEKHLQKLRQIAEQEQRQEQATTAEEFAVASFP